MSELEAPRRPGPWAAIDTGIFRNPKMKQLRNPLQRALYIASILHCADELTNGYIGEHALPQLLLEAGLGNRSHVKHLIRVGLWKADETEGWWIPDYLEWNPHKDYWELRKEKNREKAAEWRRRRKGQEVTGYVPSDVTDITRRNETKPLSVASPATDSTATQPTIKPPEPVRPPVYGEPGMADPTTLGGELEALMGRLKAGSE